MTDASKYLLLDRIAIGGMAEVYRAKSLGIAGFEKIVAIKRVLPQLAEDEDFVEMFIEEAKIAGQLQHANIAQIFELGKIDHIHFIAMEYVFGKNVRMVLDAQRKMGRRMPVSLAAWIGAQVLAGLDYAHRKRDGTGRPLGIIHRDISPPNVIVSYDGLVKLVDFGIAKAASRAVQTVAGVIKGKLAYMSPEQLRGQELDHRSDIFAATALLHEMLTGERLFDADNDFAVSELVREAKASPPSEKNPEIGPELDAVIMRGLTRERDDRWRTAGEMQEALVQAVAKPGALLGASALRSWMRTAFAEDYQREKATLERLAAVESEGVALSDEAETQDSPVYEPGSDFDDGEATMVSVPPSPPPEMLEEVELSSLVMVDESFGQFEPAAIDEASIEEDSQRGFHPSFPAPRAPDEPSVRIELPSVSDGPPSAFDVREPSGVINPSAILGEPAGTKTTLPPSEEVRPPSVRFETMGQQPTQAQPEEEEEEGGGVSILLLFFVAILALVVGVGGVVAFLYFTGRPLPFELPF